jgi:hypothetical protein
MELVEGEDLRRPLPMSAALNYARQITDARATPPTKKGSRIAASSPPTLGSLPITPPGNPESSLPMKLRPTVACN